MDFKQLEAYVKVFELGSFSKAAEAIYLSQPSVSAYVSALEKEFQTQLIFRSTKEFVPTKAGKLFYEYAKDILVLRDKSVFSIKNLSNCTTGNIDISASSVPAQYILPEILGAFHEAYPNVTFSLNQTDTALVVKDISQQHSEIGFVGAKIEPSKCVYEDFISERLIIITPYSEKYLACDPVNISRLFYDEYFIAREIGSGTRLRYEQFMKDIGVKPDKLKVSANFNNTQSIIHAVANGLGISVVSELAAKYYIRQKMILPLEIDYPSLSRNFYIVLKKNCEVAPTVEFFMKFARAYQVSSRFE